MSRPWFALCSLDPCFPRVSGDEPDPVFLRSQEGKFSPRERG